MPLPYDSDPIIDSLQDELRMQMAALNELHHPVYPSDPRRIQELERLVRELRESINARRRELSGKVGPRDASGDPSLVGAHPQAKGPDRV
ncbi:MAG: hypothetical protein H0X45_10145 [Planctomycetes bacterium]|nr:hypothetical protein [Planctomycetota bacterium]